MKVEKGKAIGTNEFETHRCRCTDCRQPAGNRFRFSYVLLPGIVINEDGTVNIDAQRMTGY